MKKEIVILLLGIGIICAVPELNGRDFKEHLSKEFEVSGDAAGSTLFIYNISGFIKVEGYSGNKVVLEMEKTIAADDEKTLEMGKKEFRLDFDQKTDTIMAYIAQPFDSRPHRNRYYYDDHGEIEYQYNVDFTVKVPFGMNLHISTVNDGIISVNNVSGILHVSNVNEEISIKNAKGTTYAHTVNGDVSVSYITNPPEESSYYTINGNIRVGYQPGLSADLLFKSMHGDLYTDFPDAELLPASTTKKQEQKSGGTVYQLNTITAVRFGKGGRTFKFETLNGNVYIKKQS
ncbi:MAG TPA: hypothetical protein VF346_09265 [Bacteroidales bacterium]